jgi:tetratricopeptide (TPR) repeat protein
MNKPNKNNKNKPGKPNTGGKPQPASSGSASKPMTGTQLNRAIALGIMLITFLTFSYTLHNQFTNWDDGLYVETNPYIKNITSENLKMILFHNITNNYYHPITMLTIAANYHFAKMEPFQYFLTNVTVHTLNAGIMFALVLMLLGAMEENGYGKFQYKPWFAAFAALCYGIHPMHVESVSWLSERKDVMYGFFYFLALMAYIKYLKANKIEWLFFTFILFMCSMFSKPLAVTFGLALLAIDVILKRDKKVSYGRIILDKSPFLIVALGGGLWAWHAQKASGSVASMHTFSFMQRTLFVTDNFLSYIWKAFLPIHLCSYYPYPGLSPGGFLPLDFLLSPFIDIIIVGGSLYLAFKAGENIFRVVLGGIAFYFFNLMFVLQFVQSGPAILAERYTYIAYLGIFLMLTYLGYQLFQKYKSFQLPIKILAGAYLLMLCVLCYDRTKIWHNTQTLWEDVIAKYPNRIETSYKNLGNFYAEKADTAHNPEMQAKYYDSAYHNFKLLEDSMHSTDAGVYSNLGNIYAIRNQFDKSLIAYKKAIKLDSNNFDVYLDLAITYSRMADYQNAILYYNKAYSKDHKSEALLRNRATTYMNAKQYANAVLDYDRLIEINPNIPGY